MTPLIHKKKINLDLHRLTRDARRINTKINKSFNNDIAHSKSYQAELAKQLEGVPYSSKYHEHYNVFTFPYIDIHALYREACLFFNEINEYPQPYCVHGWLNYLEKDDSIPWHGHWGALSNIHETYVCSYYINAEPSITVHRFPDEEISIKCENNTMSMYRDIGDKHMVPPWQGDVPRISISMDFVPLKYVQCTPFVLNTWMPVI